MHPFPGETILGGWSGRADCWYALGLGLKRAGWPGDGRAPECPDQDDALETSGLHGLAGVGGGGTLPRPSGAEWAGHLLMQTSGP